MNDEININEEMKRAHELTFGRMVARYIVGGVALFAGIIVSMGDCKMDDEGEGYKARALACEATAKAKAEAAVSKAASQ